MGPERPREKCDGGGKPSDLKKSLRGNFAIEKLYLGEIRVGKGVEGEIVSSVRNYEGVWGVVGKEMAGKLVKGANLEGGSGLEGRGFPDWRKEN